jgi:DNA-binding response OmpR family regulator
MNPVAETAAGVAFGHFRVMPHRRELPADGRPINLGGRAFDLLMALIGAKREAGNTPQLAIKQHSRDYRSYASRRDLWSVSRLQASPGPVVPPLRRKANEVRSALS